jgi:hypothetical protein
MRLEELQRLNLMSDGLLLDVEPDADHEGSIALPDGYGKLNQGVSWARVIKRGPGFYCQETDALRAYQVPLGARVCFGRFSGHPVRVDGEDEMRFRIVYEREVFAFELPAPKKAPWEFCEPDAHFNFAQVIGPDIILSPDIETREHELVIRRMVEDLNSLAGFREHPLVAGQRHAQREVFAPDQKPERQPWNFAPCTCNGSHDVAVIAACGLHGRPKR